MQKKGVALETVHTEIELHKPENKNVTWLNHPGTWVSYIIIICIGRFAFYAASFDSVTSWTLWHVSHALVSIYHICSTSAQHELIELDNNVGDSLGKGKSTYTT